MAQVMFFYNVTIFLRCVVCDNGGMKNVRTIPGRCYVVECAGPVTVANAVSGSVVAQMDGCGQVFFVAAASVYSVSDDAAVVVMSSSGVAPGGFVATSGAAVVEEVLLSPAGSEEDNFNSYGFVCVVDRSGTITQLDIECRDSGTAAPDEPVYVKVWRGTTELLARSANAQTHDVDASLSYTFEQPFEVAAGDELRVTYHTAEGMATDAYQMGVMVCQRVVALTEGESGGMLNSQGGFSNTGYTAKYTWHLRSF